MTDPCTEPRPSTRRRGFHGVIRRALALAAVLALTTAASAQAAVTDDLGREVRLDAPPSRVVSMIPSHTETVCALDACDLLVGVDTFSNEPAEVLDLPDLGSAFSADLEALLELEPDLVLTDEYSGLADVLAPLGVTVYVALPERVEDVWEVTREIGELLGRGDRASELVADLQARVEASSALAASRPPVSVYLEIDATPYSVGPGSYLGQLIALAGGANIVPEHMGDFPQLDPETIIAADPEVIVLTNAPFGESAETLAARPGWSELRALRDDRVIELTQPQVDLLNRAGPRLPDARALLSELLHPEAP